jgi:hypothetical protein
MITIVVRFTPVDVDLVVKEMDLFAGREPDLGMLLEQAEQAQSTGLLNAGDKEANPKRTRGLRMKNMIPPVHDNGSEVKTQRSTFQSVPILALPDFAENVIGKTF